MERSTDLDVIVIGGGPAGLMAAAAAAGEGARTLVLEKGDRLGRKLVISGGGRCNVTNRKPYEELIRQIPGNGRFMFSALSQFGTEEIIRFFEGLGIALKEENDGRMFPVSDRAVDVLIALLQRLEQLGVRTRTGAAVERLLLEEGRCVGVRLRDGAEIGARAVVIAVGGCSVPKTGSTGDGYGWARQAGHSITPLYPTEVPLTAADAFIRDRTLQGISLRAVTQTLFDPHGKQLSVQRGDMLFTHFGLSGPASLRTSHYVSRAQMQLGKVPLPLAIDLFPDRSPDALLSEVHALTRAEPKRSIKNVLRPLLQERMIPLLLQQAGIDEATTQAHLARERLLALVRLLKAFGVTVTGTLSLNEAFVTGGGVHIKEIDPGTMASRLTYGLYFAGEVMDVHGHTGGYNITVAFSSGHLAGISAARSAGPVRIGGGPWT